jgi:integrase
LEAGVATENVFIDKNELARAAAMAESRSTPDGKPYIFTDKGVKGLRLLVQSAKASWIVRWDNTSKTLGYHHPSDHIKSITVAQARELAQSALRMLQAGKKAEVDGLTKAFHEQRRGKKSVTKALDDLVPDVKTWTLRQCFEQTIQDKRLPAAKNPIGPQTEKDMRITMGRACFQAVLDKPAALVSPGDIEMVRDQVYDELREEGFKGESPSNKIVLHTRSVYNYCGSHHRVASGIDPMKPWWKMLAAKFGNRVRLRRPMLESVVKTLILAEEYLTKPLPGRAIKTPGTNAGTLAALWWLVLTAQRATAGLTLLPYNIGLDMERPDSGWLLAGWDKDATKGGASFVLPIPKRAWIFIDGFRQKNRNASSSMWLFPSERNPRKHATPSGVYRIIYRLAGRDEVEQKKPGKLRDPEKKERKKPIRTERRDLLEELEIDFWSPHDLRKTLTDFMKAHKIPGAASAILAHEVDEKESLAASTTAQSRSTFREQQMKRITQMAYAGGDAGAQFIELKSKAMQLWTDAVIDEYERQTGKTAAVAAEKRAKAISYFLAADPEFARQRKAAAEAAFADHIQGYQDDINAAQVKIEELRQLPGDHSRAIMLQELEIESSMLSVRKFELDRDEIVLQHAVKNRAMLMQDQAGFDPDADLPEYNAVWKEFILGRVGHDALIKASKVAEKELKNDSVPDAA